MINMSRNFNGFGMMPYRPQRNVPDYALNKNSGGIDQYGEYLEQTYGDPDFDQKRDDFLQNVSQQEQQTFGGGMNSFAPSTSPQPSMGRPMFSGQVIGSPFGGSVGSPSANQPLPSSPYESFFPNFNVHTFFQEGGSVSGPPPTHGPNANGVSNRSMFKNRDSRKKLAQMGGILSSSPELQETAMTFANGGGADLPDYIINVPGLTDVGEYLRISSATLEKLNNAVPEVMANARMVSPVEMVISEGFSSLVANARPGDAVVGTRVNRLREQRAASDPSLVPMPPEIEQVSSPEDVFAASNAANDARDNRVARSIAAANNEDLTSPAQLRADPLQSKEILGDPYAGDIFSDDRIRVRPRENVGGGIEAQDAANFEKEKIKPAQQKRGDPYAGDIVVDDRVRFRPRENIGGGIEAQDAANFALESGIAKAVPTSGGRDRDLENEELARIRQSPLFKARQPMTDAEKYGSEELQAVTGDRENNEITAENYTLGNVIVDAVSGLVPDFVKESIPTEVNVPSFSMVPTTIGAVDKKVAPVETPEVAVAAEPEVAVAAEPTEAPDATMDLLKQLDEDTRSRLGTEEELDVADPPKVTPTITPAIQEKITTSGADAGMGENFGGDGSIGDLTKDYVKLLKSLLGESDEDKAARKGELFMLMGAALMSGKSSNALTNIGNALQIGAKSAIQDRATRKKRDDTIGLKGFEMAADRIAKRDAQQLALDKEGRDKKTQLELIDARLVATNDAAQFRFDLDNLGYKKMGEYRGLGRIFETAQDGFSNEGIKKPKGITLLEYFEKLARENNYSQAQIDRYNTYFGISPSAVKDDKSGPSKAEKDLYEGLK